MTRGGHSCRLSEYLGVLTTRLGAPWSAGDKPGSAGDESASTLNHSSGVSEKQHLLWERCWCDWKSLLLVIIQRFLKLLYSVCILIYGSMYLYSYPSSHSISGLSAGGASEQFEKLLQMTIECTQRYSPRP